MNYREIINELNENLHAFPEAETVFSEKQPWLKEHFLPCISIDLVEINPEWKGITLHLINPQEPGDGLIGELTQFAHNEFIGINWLSFRLTEDNRYEFLGDERYFLRSRANKHLLTDPYLEKYFAENLKNYAEQKKAFQEKTGDYNGEPYFSKYDGLFLNSLGGERIESSNWSTSDDIPSAYKMTQDEDGNVTITHNGNRFYHIASACGYSYSHGADNIVMLYEPISRLVLFTYDWT
ncbi:hypothetical protein [Neisseria sicca]